MLLIYRQPPKDMAPEVDCNLYITIISIVMEKPAFDKIVALFSKYLL